MLKITNLRKHVLRLATSASKHADTSSIFGVALYKSLSSSTGPAETKRLVGKVAIITGGASGIGEATARLFVAHGAKVVIADIQDQLGNKILEDLGPSAEYMHCNVTREEDVSAVVDFAVSKLGGLDVMFNNAGISNAGMGPLANLDMNEFNRVMDVNVRGVLHGVKHAARVMVPAKKGSILCTASINGLVALGLNHAYTISKHAVPGIVKSAALELGEHGIRVNSISPFVVATPMVVDVFRQFMPDITPEQLSELVHRNNSDLKGVQVREEDIARAALFLASEEGRFISGHNLVVDGGFTTSKRFVIFNQ